MSDIRLYNIDMLYLLWSLPFLLGLFLYSSNRRKQALEKIIATSLQQRLVSVNPVRRRWKAALIFAKHACRRSGAKPNGTGKTCHW